MLRSFKVFLSIFLIVLLLIGVKLRMIDVNLNFSNSCGIFRFFLFLCFASVSTIFEFGKIDFLYTISSYFLSSFFNVFAQFPNINPLSAKLTRWPNTLKQFVGNLPTNCLSVFDNFVGLALKGLSSCLFKYVSLSRV